jgi:hypothetical protein
MLRIPQDRLALSQFIGHRLVSMPGICHPIVSKGLSLYDLLKVPFSNLFRNMPSRQCWLFLRLPNEDWPLPPEIA